MNPDETFGPVVRIETKTNPYEVVIQLGDYTYSCYPRLKPPTWAIYRHIDARDKNGPGERWRDNRRIDSDSPIHKYICHILRLVS